MLQGSRVIKDQDRAFVLVGIGASAGGLDAMHQLFDARPTMRGMAFVIVQHQDPASESHLVDLLATHTSLTVKSAQDGMKIEPDHIYVSVPNKDILIEDERLRLVDLVTERSRRRPIDRFFSSLAEAVGEHAVAVVLSGTGDDGSHGIRAIKAAGGSVIVQDPQTAEYDGMPRSAIDTGLVDRTVPINEMPQVLQRFAHDAQSPNEPDASEAAEDSALQDCNPATLNSILTVLHERFKYDFADYKRPTLLRRTQRRMGLRNVENFDAYAKLVRDDEDEAVMLFRDLMINVSSFFRDAAAWNELERDVIDPLVASSEDGEEIRAWVAGCATGEEAYTLCILLNERIESAGKRLTPRIFATDVSESLETARSGCYPENSVADVSPERLEKFFTKRDGAYEVKREFREMIVFAPHNVISDPPFSRMDIVTCRNLLIYLEPETQKKVLRLFNFALNDGGTLMLGSAETIGAQTDFFEPISQKWRIFRSRRDAHPGRFDYPRLGFRENQPEPRTVERRERSENDAYLAMAHRALLDRFAPPSVVIDDHHHVLVYSGDTSRYLTQPGGEPTRDLLALASPGLRPPLRNAIKEAVDEWCPVVATTGFLKRDDERVPVTITVNPMNHFHNDSRLLLVSFEERATQAKESTDADAPTRLLDEHEGQTVEQLEEELRLTRDELRTVSEQYDRLYEDYSTSNEEMLSINEELQSSNEELETSKEELQSLNEELHTLNNELRSKMEYVEDINNDLNNLLASTEIATLFLDINCNIRWFAPAITQVLRLIDTDLGRPISDIASTVTGSKLDDEASRVLETLVPLETEVESEDGRHFIRRVSPYRTSDNRIDGAVVTFVDITDRKKAELHRERLMRELSHRIKNTLATVQVMVHGLARRSESLPDFLEAFNPRLAALARAHSLLAMPGDERLELRDLLARELEPYIDPNTKRVTLEGGSLTLSRDAAVALELVLHELVTNATKYGALANESGTITVHWKVNDADGSTAQIEWIESGGLPVQKSTTTGFGSSLIQSSVEYDLGGKLKMDFNPDGLHCVIEFPHRQTNAGSHNTDAQKEPSDGRHAHI